MDKLKVFTCLICQLLYNVLNVSLAWVIMQITDSLVIENGGIFSSYLKIAALVVIGQIVFNYLSIRLQNKIICTSMCKIRTKCLNGVLKGKGRFLNEDEKTKYLAYFTSELEQYENSYLRTKLNILNSIMLLILSSGMIFQLHRMLLVIVFILIACMILVPFMFSKSLQKANTEYLNSNKELIKKTEEILSGYEIIKSFFAGNRIIELYGVAVKNSTENRRNFANKMGASNVVTGVMSIFIILFTFVVGGYLILKSLLTVGALLAVIQLVTNMISPLMDVLYGINEMNSVKEIRDRVNMLCKQSDEQGEKMICSSIGSKIEISNLSFKYPEQDMDVIKNVSAVLEKGKIYAVIGENGSGKSTFAKIISGYYMNYSGEIKIDGLSMKKIPENWIRSRIIYINQKDFLFDASPRDNYTIFEQYEMNPDLINSIGAAELMNKEQTVITMSGGERQKIIFLRGISRKSDVIVCDEAASAMDVFAKKKFLELLKNDKERIKINITHTIDDSLKEYDSILYLKDGVLCEQGNFNELYSMKGDFYKFYRKKRE